MRALLGVVFLLSGCLSSDLVPCGSEACPAGNVCTAGGCATRDAVGACDGRLEEAMCMVGTSRGYCVGGACRESVCGDGVTSPGEVCDDGNVDPRDMCAADCRSTEACGNGIADFLVGEECDDGNQDETDGCHSDCKIARCGDGVLDLEGGEACDDGAANGNTPDTACRTNCQPKRCADGVKDTGEVCDDGNLASGDGCAGDCLSSETCGNGITDLAADEECDDGNQVDNDRCRNSCKLAACGDGVMQPVNGENCDAGAQNSNAANASCRVNCQPQRCGDGITDGGKGEVCDDGNQLARDGCSADCQSTEVCGNNIVDGATGEQCDTGIAGLANDGCSSRCFIEGRAWDVADPLTITARFSHSAAWDGARGELVVFGGDDEDHVFDDTWVWNGNNWDVRETPVAPPGRSGSGLAYDAGHQRVVMFGGSDPHKNTSYADTWLWDGDTWALQSPAHSPPAGSEVGLAYDSDLQRIVLVNGMGQTWTWNGTDWTQLTIPNLGALQRPALAYDASRHVMLLYACGGNDIDGGMRELGPSGWSAQTAQRVAECSGVMTATPFGAFVYGGNTTEVWSYDGSWHARSPMPKGMSTPAGAYDPIHNTLVSVGGFGPVSPGVYFALPDTYTMPVPSGTWSQRTPISPDARYFGSVAYDRARGELVMFGGMDASNAIVDTKTWIRRGRAWKSVSPGGSPPARWHAGMTYDESLHVMLLFGGSGNGGALGDMWSFDGANWTQHPVVGPHPSGNVVMAYHATRGETIILSGTGGSWDEVWSWKNDVFTSLGTLTNFSEPRITYDRARGVIVVHDELNQGALYEYDGQWTELHPPTTMPIRNAGMLTYDERRQRVIVFGGYDYLGNILGDTWEWDGATWLRLGSLTPARRWAGMMAYDPRAGATVLYGGTIVTSTTTSSTYSLEFTSPDDPRDLCAGVDTDGDGLAGCADPDCYARCTPYCAPGEQTCVAGQPSCGDGTCSVLEGSSLCPADCPP